MNNSEKSTHVLVVEDELNFIESLRYSLQREGYRVTTISDGQEALDVLQTRAAEFDLIVLDIMLPGKNGYEICDSIRKRGVLTPIMFLSARTLPEDRARGFNVGANQYLAKPFELDEFLARIRNLLMLHQLQMSNFTHLVEAEPELEPGPDSRLDSEVKIGDATIFFDLMEVHRGEEVIHLTQLECSLLRYFLQNANRLISKDELLKNVWKMPGALNTRAPDQFILRLRRIFEPDPTKPVYFLTLRNAGYRFVPED